MGGAAGNPGEGTRGGREATRTWDPGTRRPPLPPRPGREWNAATTPLCFPPPGAKGQPATRSGSPSPLTVGRQEGPAQVAVRVLRGDGAVGRPRLAGVRGGGWGDWAGGTHLTRDGGVGGRRQSSLPGAEVDVHCALGQDRPGGRGGQRGPARETQRAQSVPEPRPWAAAPGLTHQPAPHCGAAAPGSRVNCVSLLEAPEPRVGGASAAAPRAWLN